MIFHENRLLADDSHEISYLIFLRKLGKMSQNLLSTAVGALRAKYMFWVHKSIFSLRQFSTNSICFSGEMCLNEYYDYISDLACLLKFHI